MHAIFKWCNSHFVSRFIQFSCVYKNWNLCPSTGKILQTQEKVIWESIDMLKILTLSDQFLWQLTPYIIYD